MSVSRFLNLSDRLEEKSQRALETCISCPRPADYRLIRLSLCRCHGSVRYGVCKNCRDERKSEKVIQDEMRLAHLYGQRHTPREFKQLLQEALQQNWW
jgi:hypothetical protein